MRHLSTAIVHLAYRNATRETSTEHSIRPTHTRSASYHHSPNQTSHNVPLLLLLRDSKTPREDGG